MSIKFNNIQQMGFIHTKRFVIFIFVYELSNGSDFVTPNGFSVIVFIFIFNIIWIMKVYLDYEF